MPPPVCPLLTVDAILLVRGGVVLVRRKHEPLGWALPGGFVDRGESVEDACVREVLEETGLSARLIRQFHVYSDPSRDARGHTVSVCFVAEADGEPRGGDDAAAARVFSRADLPKDLCFDHGTILDDYFLQRY